ncbi:hypothetical protein NPIL_133491 [Nephila pilipes]|uniref:Uncharacterized protein n=1 Tax=Nephila pilipes TaxID=299642 RepID=A0A8X6MWV8_NEPPI|nr:hypothetical protein NPIL_133491 [Nephila pilipes]
MERDARKRNGLKMKGIALKPEYDAKKKNMLKPRDGSKRNGYSLTENARLRSCSEGSCSNDSDVITGPSRELNHESPIKHRM